jgi:hypothetical protein
MYLHSLYWCETWPLTLKEEHRLRAFANRVLRRISGLKKEGENCLVRSFMYSSPNTIRMIKPRRMRWAGNVARNRAKNNADRILVGTQEAKRPTG